MNDRPKRRLTGLVGALVLSLGMLASGCAVRVAGPGPVVASVRGPGLVVVAPAPLARAPRHAAYRKRCHRVCTPSRCYTRCRKVLYAHR